MAEGDGVEDGESQDSIDGLGGGDGPEISLDTVVSGSRISEEGGVDPLQDPDASEEELAQFLQPVPEMRGLARVHARDLTDEELATAVETVSNSRFFWEERANSLRRDLMIAEACADDHHAWRTGLLEEATSRKERSRE